MFDVAIDSVSAMKIGRLVPPEDVTSESLLRLNDALQLFPK